MPLKLSQLQNFCKRDPDGYKEDYDAQSRRLVSLVGILQLSPNADPSKDLVELIQFMAAVSSSSYKGEESDRVAGILMDLLVGSSSGTGAAGNTQQPAAAVVQPMLETTLPLAALQLHRGIRQACVSALILMRNKGAVKPLRLLQLFFQLLAVVPDKNLRESLYHHIVNDVRNINKNGKKDEKLNRTIQSFFHRVVTASANESTPGGEDSPTDYAAKRAVQMICDLYRRNVWNDERSVHILATAASSPNANVATRALRFFLNIEEQMSYDHKQEEESEWGVINVGIDLHLHSKKTKAKTRLIVKQLKNRMRKQHAREGLLEAERVDKGVEVSQKLFPAIELLNNPQGICETILKRIKSSGSNTYKFEVKMLMLNFVSRVVGNHELLLLPLYTLLQRYMGGHQRDVTAILAYSVQACHSYVPPEEIHGILKTVAHNFVTERCTGEQMAVGINACRAICARVPSVLSAEDDIDEDGKQMSTSWDVEAFVQDLAGFAKHNDRSVSIAGRGWVNFIREVYPSLLQGKHRGLVGAGLHRAGEKPLRYGEVRAASGVEGSDLLVAYEAAKKNKKAAEGDSEEEEDDEDGWVKMNDEEEDKDEAPDLVLLEEDDDEDSKPKAEGDDDDASEPQLDLSKLSSEERAKIKQEVSSTRVFTTAEFAKMAKLVDRQQRAKRDPRLAAKLKHAKAKGEEYDDMSDSDSDMDSDDDEIHIKGAVNNTDIMAEAKRKRVSKAEKLEKIIEGRQKWEAKQRPGGSTNTEKMRKKSFAMSKFSFATRTKLGEKETAKHGRKTKNKVKNDGRAAKKRRRR